MFGFERTDYDKKVYEEELVDFLPKNIVDVHTHVYRKEDKDQLPPGTPIYWPRRVAEDNTIEDIIQTYKDLFPKNNVVPVIFGCTKGNYESINAYSAENSKKYGYPALLIDHADWSPEYVEEQVIKGGFQGLKPYLNNQTKVNGSQAGIYDYLPKSHLELANKYGWKVTLHISKPDRLKNEDNIKTLMEIDEKYTNAKVIVAHIGRAYAPEDLGNAFDTLKHSQNLLFDFSANTLGYATQKCIEAVGTKRVMFGTDLPIAKMRMYRISEDGYYINVVPRGLYGDLTDAEHMRESDEETISNFTYEIIRGFKDCAKALTLSKQDVEDIMCNNAAKLFNIKF